MIFDPFLTLGYVEIIKVFLHPINAVPQPEWMKINRQIWTGRMYELTLAFLELLSELKKAIHKRNS